MPDNKSFKQVSKLEVEVSDLTFELEEIKLRLNEEVKKREFYQSIADFTFGWELWFEPNGIIKYCSPSCFDLTGFTSNQIIAELSISELLIYKSDQEKFNDFIQKSLDQTIINQALEFRILTRTKQLRWCLINVRGVYDKQGKYLGIRTSIQDITRLKRAMGHIHEMEAGKQLEKNTKVRLQNELELKDRELISFLLQLSQKNEILSKVSNLLSLINFNNTSRSQKQIAEISELVENNFSQPLDWMLIENQIEKLHPGFLIRLQTKHPTISVKNKKLCVYLRLGLSSKEISGLLNITYKSVEIARVRLRKKLKLTSNIRLTNYLEHL